MIIIVYSRAGTPVSDFEHQSKINGFKWMIRNGFSQAFSYSSSTFIHAVRLAILKGELDRNKVRFKYKGKLIYQDEQGLLSSWPDGFCDIQQKISRDIINIRCNQGAR